MNNGHDQPKKRHPTAPDSVPDQDYVSSDDLFGEFVDAPMPGQQAPARPSRTGPIKVQVTDPRPGADAARSASERAASDTEVEALLSRIEPFLAPPVKAPEPPTAPDFDDELPVVAARTSTKFQAAPPAPPVAEDPGLDLAVLAENAIAEATPVPAPPRGKGSKEGAWRDDQYGPYRLLDRIAVGGMAEVFKAKRSGVEGFEKIVAMKRILPHLSDNKEFVDMFVDEA
ncbi:MAG: hypothetical protein ACHQKZ_09020, partial [Solirubrobacterales bacterium]